MTYRSGDSQKRMRFVKAHVLTGLLGVLVVLGTGCATRPPTPSMAPGPTPTHGFPGVSVSEGHSQWPQPHRTQAEPEHRIYSETSPPPPPPPPPKKPPKPVLPGPSKKVVKPLQKTIYFSFNSARLTYWDKVILDRWSDLLKKTPYRLILLHGSTDPLGSEAYNKKLGMKRSLSVKRYLVFRGIPSKKIRALSWGDRKSRTFSSCRRKTALCHSQSRSVRIDVIDEKKPSSP